MNEDDRLLGSVLDGRWRIEAVIGQGHGGGIVYRGRDAQSGASVVVRCPRVPDLPQEQLDEAFETFTAEAALLAKVGAATNDIEKLLASGITDDRQRIAYCVFEWLAGHSLEQDIHGPALSIGEAMTILEPAARALAAAHALGAAHRDVRPANLWLSDQGGRTRMKLAAFGLASKIGTDKVAFAPEYGAPEHFKKSYGVIGPATDVFGLGLVLVEMVSGRPALTGNDEAEMYLASSDLGRRPTLRARGAQVSEAVEQVVARALAVDPKRRFTDARELWEALVLAVPELTPAAPSVRPREEPTRLPSAPPPGMMFSRPFPSMADDRRLETGRAQNFTPPPPPKKKDRGGTWAWLAVAIMGVVAVLVIATKVKSSPKPPPPKPVASADAAVATPAPKEQAVQFQSFLTDMVQVPAGTFTMGPEKGHRVTLSHAFYMDRTEVVASSYAACVDEGACTANRVHGMESQPESTWGCNTEKERPNHPANCVDRSQAAAYCTWAKKRLPTEAEWEYAARGTDGRDYPWGPLPPTSCNQAILREACPDRPKGTWEIGSTPEGKSAFGLLDMAGNVWEWVSDGYADYPPGDVTDPKGAPPTAQPRERGILRGGSWDYSVQSAKTTYRLPFTPAVGNVSVGFRCARDVP